jgi:CO/xanthine dehydrogenase Mo-binding subunit
VWSATQIPHYLHRELARVLGLAPARIRVIQPHVGGAFGGKSDPFSLEFCVAKLAMRTGRPVKILFTREEVFYAHRGRHPMQMHFEVGADGEGRITAVRSKILIDGGAYASYGLVTAYYAGQLLTGPYHFPTYAFDATRLYTNKPPCGPKRGHGSVQPRFAFEVALDEVAERLAIDPIEIRRKNYQGEGVTTVNGQRITSNGFDLCLDAVERSSDWKARHGKLARGHGLGVAGSMYISGTNYPIYPNRMPQAAVQVKLDRSGKVTVFSGASDIGQGCDSLVAYIACEELGCELGDVRVVAADTDLCPVDLGAYSSRVTFMVGNACIDACRTLRVQICAAVAERWQVSAKEVVLAGGLALLKCDSGKQLPLAEAFQWAEEKYGAQGSVGSYNTPKLGGDYRGGTIGASPAYSFTAHVVEVHVDVETGSIEVERAWIAHDCGRALNPALVEGQMEGSAYMGIAEALMEEHAVYTEGPARGLHRGPSLLDYRIPTIADTPELCALIVESFDPEGPYGAKEAGEGPLHPSIPAIANAVFDAVGVRLRSLPFTPDRVWRLLRC